MSQQSDACQDDQVRKKAAASSLPQLSPDALKPTERERRLLEDLFDWQERSRKTHWILGEPLGMRP